MGQAQEVEMHNRHDLHTFFFTYFNLSLRFYFGFWPIHFYLWLENAEVENGSLDTSRVARLNGKGKKLMTQFTSCPASLVVDLVFTIC